MTRTSAEASTASWSSSSPASISRASSRTRSRALRTRAWRLGLHAVDVALRGDHRLAHPPVEALPLLQLAPESGLALAQRGTAGLGLVERASEVLEELVDAFRL